MRRSPGSCAPPAPAPIRVSSGLGRTPGLWRQRTGLQKPQISAGTTPAQGPHASSPLRWTTCGCVPVTTHLIVCMLPRPGNRYGPSSCHSHRAVVDERLNSIDEALLQCREPCHVRRHALSRYPQQLAMHELHARTLDNTAIRYQDILGRKTTGLQCIAVYVTWVDAVNDA